MSLILPWVSVGEVEEAELEADVVGRGAGMLGRGRFSAGAELGRGTGLQVQRMIIVRGTTRFAKAQTRFWTVNVLQHRYTHDCLHQAVDTEVQKATVMSKVQTCTPNRPHWPPI